MNGRDVFMGSLLAHGVRHLFGNPGTTESPLIDSLARYPALSYVLTLHEGVAIGAASYYAQASGRTGVVNLHAAPGLGNAIGMIYGALRANSPMVITAGQQDTRLRLRDPILGHDLVAMAAPVVKWSVQAETADEIAPIMRRAFKTAHDPPSGPVFVSLPINVMEQQTDIAAVASGTLYRAPAPDPEGVRAIARQLLAATGPAIVIGDDVARAGAGDAVIRLAEATGAEIWAELIQQHQPVPNAHPNFHGRLPSDAVRIAESLDDADLVLLVGGPFFEEVWHAPAGPFPPGAAVIQIEETTERLARNHALSTGLIAGLGPALEAVSTLVLTDRSSGFAAAADSRNERFAALRAKQTDGAARAPGKDAGTAPDARCPRNGDAGRGGAGRHGNRRGGDHRQPRDPARLRLLRSRGLFLRPRRRDRPGHRRRARCEAGVSGAAGGLHFRRRLGDVLDPVLVDGRRIMGWRSSSSSSPTASTGSSSTISTSTGNASAWPPTGPTARWT